MPRLHAPTCRALFTWSQTSWTRPSCWAAFQMRMRKAAVALLDNAADARFDDLPAVTFTLLAAMAGTTRAVFEHGATPSMLRMLRLQLAAMCQA